MAVAYKVDPEQRRHMIAEAAYFRAERRGFGGDQAHADWLAAEREVDAILSGASDDWLERLESQLAAVSERLQQQKRRISRMKAEARSEWQEELEKLAKLRDKFAKKLEEIREQGEHAGKTAKRQAEQLWEELSGAVHRISARQK